VLDKIKQAQRMWEAGNTHGEIKEVTGLSHEIEYTATEIARWHSLTAEQVYVKIPFIKPGMTSEEIEAIFTGEA
jgi:hypothetical protein